MLKYAVNRKKFKKNTIVIHCTDDWRVPHTIWFLKWLFAHFEKNDISFAVQYTIVMINWCRVYCVLLHSLFINIYLLSLLLRTLPVGECIWNKQLKQIFGHTQVLLGFHFFIELSVPTRELTLSVLFQWGILDAPTSVVFL